LNYIHSSDRRNCVSVVYSPGVDPKGTANVFSFQNVEVAQVFPLICRCFLLTPKLLPDLEYSEACSVLNIMNGPWIEQPSKGNGNFQINLYLFIVFKGQSLTGKVLLSVNSVWSSGDCWATVTGLVGESRC
jgi:hypothetical protein